jgi:hypothetical protein
MKIEFTPKRVRLARVAIALVAISLAGYVAYAATTLSISNTGSVVNVTTNLFAVVDVASSTTCSATTGTYADTGLSITTWSVQVGLSQTKYACIENTGTSAHLLVITQTGTLPSGVTFSSAGGTVGAAGFLLVSFTLAASTGATTGPLNFGITIS